MKKEKKRNDNHWKTKIFLWTRTTVHVTKSARRTHTNTNTVSSLSSSVNNNNNNNSKDSSSAVHHNPVCWLYKSISVHMKSTIVFLLVSIGFFFFFFFVSSSLSLSSSLLFIYRFILDKYLTITYKPHCARLSILSHIWHRAQFVRVEDQNQTVLAEPRLLHPGVR